MSETAEETLLKLKKRKTEFFYFKANVQRPGNSAINRETLALDWIKRDPEPTPLCISAGLSRFVKPKKKDRQTRRGIARIRAYCIYLREMCLRSVFVDRPISDPSSGTSGMNNGRINVAKSRKGAAGVPLPLCTLAPCRITRSRNLRAIRATRKCIASTNLWRRSKRRSVQKPIGVNCCADRPRVGQQDEELSSRLRLREINLKR